MLSESLPVSEEQRVLRLTRMSASMGATGSECIRQYSLRAWNCMTWRIDRERLEGSASAEGGTLETK